MSIHNIPSKGESTFLRTLTSYMTALPSRLRLFSTIVLLCAGCSGFGDVGKQYRVDSGVDPREQDEDVRFRTTYYFRVFDACEVLDEESRINDEYETIAGTFTKRKKGKYRLLSDSLYRFRMTGKASAWFQKVHFESGTLRAEQIDPFGATVDYDEQTGKFRVQSARANREIDQRKDIYTEIDRLYNLRKKMKEHSSEDQVAIHKIEDLILEQLQLLSTKDQTKVASMFLTLSDVRRTVKDAISASETALKDSGNTAVEATLKEMKSNDKLSPPTQESDFLSKMEYDQKQYIQDLIQTLDGTGGVIEKLNSVLEPAEVELQSKRQAFDVAREEQSKAEELNNVAIEIEKIQKKIAEINKKNLEIPKELQGQLTGYQKALGEAGKSLDKAKDHFKSMSNNLEEAKEALKTSQQKLDQLQDSRRQVVLQTKRLWRLAETRIGSSKTGADKRALSPSSPRLLTCSDGRSSRRGFQVLGPEGFRSFDQDERLIMAMSSDAKPLISLIQQVSEHQLSAEADQSSGTKLMKQERVRLEVVGQELDKMKLELKSKNVNADQLTPEVILQRVLEQFNKTEEMSLVPDLKNFEGLVEK